MDDNLPDSRLVLQGNHITRFYGFMLGSLSPKEFLSLDHPQRNEIDRELAKATVSKRGIAQRFGFTPDAVERHARYHLPATLVKARKASEVFPRRVTAQADGLASKRGEADPR